MKTWITEYIDGTYCDIRIKANSWYEAESVLSTMNRKDVIIIGELIDDI